MSRILRQLVILPVLPVAAAAIPVQAQTVIHDQSFTPGTWDVLVSGGTNVTGATISQEINGGITGNAQRTSVTGSGSYTFDVQHFKTDLVWNPATDGRITSLDWEVWYRVRNADEFAGMQLIARQGDSTYRAPSTYFEPQLFQNFWQRTTRSISIGAFNKISGPGLSDLEFEFDSEPIEFGYMLSRGIFRSGVTTYRTSFWVLDINAEPLVLAGDYNDDGRVDLADYTRWRDNLGASANTLANDAVGGVIGDAQYESWKQNFGASRPEASAASVPEPGTHALLITVAVLSCCGLPLFRQSATRFHLLIAPAARS